MYESILAKIPPRVVLDPYWQVIDAIRWIPEKFTLSDLRERITSEIEEYGRIGLESLCDELRKALNVIDETVGCLVDAGLLEESEDGFVRSEDYNEFFRFLRESFRNNIRSIVAWAVWYLYDKSLSEFETSDVLSIVPSLTEDRVERTLKSLNVEFKDGRWRLTEESLSIVRMYLMGRISNWWPVFGTYFVKKEKGGEAIKFFKIAGGVSSRYYVDFPNDFISYYVSNIYIISIRSVPI